MVDYRGLNARTQHDRYTLPLMEDMLQKYPSGGGFSR